MVNFIEIVENNLSFSFDTLNIYIMLGRTIETSFYIIMFI